VPARVADVQFRSRLATSTLESTSLGEAASYALNGCLDAVLEVKLGEYPGDVVGDGVRAQREVSRDLVVAIAAGSHVVSNAMSQVSEPVTDSGLWTR
jgi:hypothetical protein